MLVENLIVELKKLNPKSQVVVHDDYDGERLLVKNIQQEKDLTVISVSLSGKVN